MKRIKSVVQAGVVDDISSIIKSLFDTIFKSIDKLLDDSGYSKKDQKHVKEKGFEGTETVYESGDGDSVLVKVLQTNSNPDLFEVTIQCEGHKPLVKRNVKEDKIEAIIDNYMDTVLESSNEGPIDSSKRVRVTLKKITSGTESEVHLTCINANYDIVEAMTHVKEVLADDEFVDNLSDEPASFEISETLDGEGFDVEEIDNDNVDVNDSYRDMFYAAAAFKNNLQYIHWGAKGQKFVEIHNMVDSMLWSANDYVDTLAELTVEKTNFVPHLGLHDAAVNVDHNGLDYEGTLEYLLTSIKDYVNVLESYYVNMDHDVQSLLDDWIRSLNKNADYFIKRMLTK